MLRIFIVVMVGTCWAGLASADDPPKPAAAAGPEFKVSLNYFGVAKEPLIRAEFDIRRNKIYQSLDNSPEILVFDRSSKLVRLIDLARQVQTEITFEKIESGIDALRAELREGIARDEKSEDRADRVEAAMDRDLLEPRFTVVDEPASNQIRLTNPSVEVVASGEPEPDPTRLAILRDALVINAELDAIRQPENLPPFAHLDTISRLFDRKLRPKEMTFLFRLAGPPKKFRWVFTQTPSLTDRDREGLARIDRLLETTPHLDFARYERTIVPRRKTEKP